MGKLPAFLMYPKDWLTDTELRRCSRQSMSVWMDLLCLMFGAPNRGVLADAGGRAWSDQEIAAALSGDTGANLECLTELLSKGVAHRNDRGAIFSRRQVRDEEERKADKKRKQLKRVSGNCPVVIPVNVRSDSGIGTATEDVSAIVYELLRIYPTTKHRTKISYIEETKACEAIARDGRELVLAGTKLFAQIAETWPESEKKYIMSFAKFMETQEYLADPKKWERGSNGQQTSTAQRRVDNTRTNLTNAVRNRVAQRVGHPSGEQQNGADGEPKCGDVTPVRRAASGSN